MTAPKSSSVPSLWHTYKRMRLAAGSRAPALRRSIALFIAAAVCQGLAFASFYPLLDAVFTAPDIVPAAAPWLAVMVVLTAADMLLRWRAHAFDHGPIIADVTHELRVRLGDQLRRMPLEALSRRRTGDLNAILAGNVDEVVVPMGVIGSIVIRTVVVPLVVVAATLAVDWRLALAFAVLFPLALPLYRWKRRLAARAMRANAEAHARVEADLIEYTQGIAVLRALGQTGSRSRRLQESLRVLRRLQGQAQWRSAGPALLMASLVEIGLALVLVLGVMWIAGGTLTVAALAAAVVIVMRFAEPLAIFASVTEVFDFMEAGFARIEALLAIPPLPVTAGGTAPGRFDVTLTDVTFTYAEQTEPALRGVSLAVPERSLTALVGPSGSGKTTVTRLIQRFADPQAGTVRIGGTDVRSLPPEEVARLVSVVFQDVYLFDDTILDNIRMGRPDASDAAVMAAARAAHCHDFISRLPDGYLTRVGDIGGSLSGGERQRISIARAILKDAPIVILDEPTAALDTESEAAVQAAIDALVRDRTVIVIAHRLSTIRAADQILVFDDGRLVERGDHAALSGRDGRYAAMWRAQEGVKQWHRADAAPPVPA